MQSDLVLTTSDPCKEHRGAVQRLAYSVNEFIRDVIPMSRDKFYSEIACGNLRTLKIGRRRFVSVEEAIKYIREREKEAS